MCEDCNETREKDIDLYLKWKKEAKTLMSYERWLEERLKKRIKDDEIIQKANEEIRQVIEDEFGTGE